MLTVRENADLLLLPAIRKRLMAEAQHDHGPGVYWAVLSRADGFPLIKTSSPDITPPLSEQVMFAMDMVEALNRHLHHDGAWIVAYTNPGRTIVLDAVTVFHRFVFLWIDADADPGFSVECSNSSFEDVLMRGPDYWMQEAARHYATYQHHMKTVIDTKAQKVATFKAAQGEVAPSVLH